MTYRSGEAIAGLIAALPAGAGLVVVDNASGDGTADRVTALAPAARVIRNAENLGFGAGCNAGLACVETEFALLLNPDARLAPGAIEDIVAVADRFPDAAILGPAIRAPDGRLVRSYNVGHAQRGAFPRKRDAEPWPDGPVCMDFVSGAAMLVRRADALRFDESLFLFYEDDEICAAARGRGRSVIYVPGATVHHAGGKSSAPSMRIRWRKAFHMARSRQVFGSRHGGTDAGARLRRHAGKAIGHALVLRWGRVVEDLAGFAGTLSWLRDRGRR